MPRTAVAVAGAFAAYAVAVNSATGYLSSGLINDWAKTQTLSLSTQLSAGARSLNLRPSLEPDGQLYSRHGPVLVPVPLSALLADIRRWAAAHPLELVQLHVSKCADNLNRAAATLHSSSSFSSSSAAAAAAVAAARARGGAACWDRARALFAAAGVLTPPRCVSPLSSVADVWSAATAAAGRQDAGAIVALEPHCVEENYDEFVECTGILTGAEPTANSTYSPPTGASGGGGGSGSSRLRSAFWHTRAAVSAAGAGVSRVFNRVTGRGPPSPPPSAPTPEPPDAGPALWPALPQPGGRAPATLVHTPASAPAPAATAAGGDSTSTSVPWPSPPSMPGSGAAPTTAASSGFTPAHGVVPVRSRAGEFCCYDGDPRARREPWRRMDEYLDDLLGEPVPALLTVAPLRTITRMRRQQQTAGVNATAAGSSAGAGAGADAGVSMSSHINNNSNSSSSNRGGNGSSGGRRRYVWTHPSMRQGAAAPSASTVSAPTPALAAAPAASSTAPVPGPALARGRSDDIAQSLPLEFATELYPPPARAGARAPATASYALSPAELNALTRAGDATVAMAAAAAAAAAAAVSEAAASAAGAAVDVAAGADPSRGRVTVAQAHWQYSTTSVVLGALRGSSVVRDQRRSALNAEVAARIDKDTAHASALPGAGAGVRYSDVRMIEVDDAEDGGPALAAALRRRADMLQARGVLAVGPL